MYKIYVISLENVYIGNQVLDLCMCAILRAQNGMNSLKEENEETLV